MRQIPSLKKWWDFRRSSTEIKKFTNFVCFLNIPGKQQHFNLTYGKLVDLVYCFHGESFFFRTKLTETETVSEPFIFSRFTRNFSAKRVYPQTPFTYCIFISNPLNI